MLDFEGDSAPYVLYTFARAQSILRKAGQFDTPHYSVLEKLCSEDEFSLARLLDGFPAAVQRAAEANEPYILLRQITGLARAFNRYYHNESILGTLDDDLKLARLSMLTAVCYAIRTGLDLLGIQTVDRM